MRSLKQRITYAVLFTLLLAFAGCTRDPAKRESAFVASADKYFAAGKYDEAIKQYRNALKIDPNSSALYYSLGGAYAGNQQYRESFLSFKSSSELDANNFDAKMALAKFYLIAKQNDDSIKLLKEVLQSKPDNDEAQVLLADAYAGKRDMGQATKLLQDVLGRNPNFLPALLKLGVLYSAQNKEPDARAVFQKAVKVNPESIEAHRAMAADAIRRGQMQEAETEFRAAVDANPQSDVAARALADFYSGTGRAVEAEAAFKRLAELQKNTPDGQFSLASFYFGQKQYDEAMQIDSRIAKDNPKFISARLQLIEIALAKNDADLASKLVDQLLNERPKEPQALVLRAGIALERKQPAKAITDLETAQRLDPNAPMLYYEMGKAYEQQGNVERAQGSFQRALEINQDFVLADDALGDIMFSRGQWDAALKYAAEVLRRNPQEPRALLLAGNSESALQNYPAAKQAFEQYVKAYPNSSDGPLRLGLLALAQKQNAEAEKHFQQCLDLNRKEYRAIKGLVAIRLNERQNEKAIQIVQQHLQSDQSPLLYNMLGEVYVAVAQYPQAEAAFKRSLELDPQNFTTHSTLGALYEREHSVDRAATEYEAALKINDKSAGMWTIYGMLQDASGRLDAAEKAYLKALDIDPNSVDAANNLASIYCEQGRELDKALDLAQGAKAARPDIAAFSDTLGWIYYKRQLFESAVPLFQQAIKQQPDHAVFHYHLAATLSKEGKKNQAKAELSSALKLDSTLRNRNDVKNLIGELSL